MKTKCNNNLSENQQKMESLNNVSEGKHSFRQLGTDYFVDIELEFMANSRLVLFNRELANSLNLNLPEMDKQIELHILENFAWFKSAEQNNTGRNKSNIKKLFSTRYQDSDDKSVGSALGDGRASWAGEIVKECGNGQYQYFDIVLKGTGATELAWLNHPRESHKDGMLSLNEAVHEYIYSKAASANNMRAVGVLAVIELPFKRAVDNEKAAIVVRVGNHLRFAHFCYFSDNAVQLKTLFEYSLKRNMGLPLSYSVKTVDVKNYLDFIINNLALDAAIYFDLHAVHGSPTFGNITSCGGGIDFATFVYIDAHHSQYSYMDDGVNCLGGEWGQTEQFFNLFSKLIQSLRKSRFTYADDIPTVEYFLRQFNNRVEQTLTKRWLMRIGLSKTEIDLLSIESKERFYENVKILYELSGTKKIKFKQRKVQLAAFEPRKILSSTAECIGCLNDINTLWKKLFKVNRRWGRFKLSDARPYIDIYRNSIANIINELKATDAIITTWQHRSAMIKLSERNEPGIDFFYDSERFFASEETMQHIKSGINSWHKISEIADISALKLVDHGIGSKKSN